jgi:membrane protein
MSSSWTTALSVALLSYLYTPEEAIQDTIALAAWFLPPDMVKFLDDHVRELFTESKKIGLAGFLVLLWSGRQLFRAMELALHKAWEIPLDRNWFVGNLLAMMLVLLCTAVVLAVGATSLALTWLSATLRQVEFPQMIEQRWDLADAIVMSHIHSWVVVPTAVTVIFLLLYIILPSRRVPVSMAIPGALFSCIAWKLSTWIYLTIIVQAAAENPFLATVWGVVGLLVWLYIEATVFMLGAELVFVNLDEAERVALGKAVAVKTTSVEKKTEKKSEKKKAK